MNEDEKLIYLTILRKEAEESDIRFSLKNLTEYLHRYYGEKPWVLIDEYDTPIQSGYLNGYYDEIITLMRNLFGAVLKTNAHLHRSVITGILRIARESLFSDVNNLEIYSLLRSEYGQYFGFTEEEVNSLIQQSGLESMQKIFAIGITGIKWEKPSFIILGQL